MPKKFTFNVEINDDGKRIDQFLVEKMQSAGLKTSRSRIQSLIDSGQVSNEKIISIINSYSRKIRQGEQISITIPEPQPTQIMPSEIDFEIIFEDENMLVINKPAGLTTHPGHGNQQNTLVNALLFYLGNNLSGINGIMRPGIVHRLDKDTSGLMIIAKNDIAHIELSRQIAERSLKRSYLAFCYGTPRPISGIIDKNIGRSKINRLKMVVMKTGGRHAISFYNVIKTYADAQFSMVEFRLQTGRTHQIRVHSSSIGHSIIGDQIYGNRKKSLKNIDNQTRFFLDHFPRQALHSYSIAFLHPITHEEMQFTIDLPKDLQELEKKLYQKPSLN